MIPSGGARGFSILSVIIGLAMLAVLTSALTLAILQRVAEARLERAIIEVSTLETAVASWVLRTAQSRYAALSSVGVLVQNGAAPSRLADDHANPWGGGYDVVGAGDAFAILVGRIPDAHACSTMGTAFQARATTQCPDSYPGEAAIVFGDEAQRQQIVTVAPFAEGGDVIASRGINCGPAGSGTCNATVALGTMLTLTARPAPGYTLDRWTGCNSMSGAECVVTASGPRIVTPVFSIAAYVVTVSVLGNGTIAAAGISCPGDCSESYPPGTTVSLTAIPSTGYTFRSWSGCDSPSGNQCQVTANAARTVVATFVPAWALSVSVQGAGTGSITSAPSGITCPGDCSEAYVDGTLVTLTATPGTGSLFVGWSGACAGTNPTCTVSMTAAQTVTARLDAGETLTVTVEGPGAVQAQ